MIADSQRLAGARYADSLDARPEVATFGDVRESAAAHRS
jgi:hypothetical protein